MRLGDPGFYRWWSSMTARWLAMIVSLVLLVAVSVDATPRQLERVARIGVLSPLSPRDSEMYIEALQQGLRELGYVEGQNVVIERRYSLGRDEQLPDLATELVRLKIDVIVTWGTPAARAAKNATTTIPIVTGALVDPVATGLVASLARPGGNLTGLTSGGADLSRKNLDLLGEAVPRLSRIAVLWNTANSVMNIAFKETEIAAQTLRIKIYPIGVVNAQGLDAAFTALTKERPGALLVLHDPMLQAQRQRIVDFANNSRLPAMYERKPWVDAGGLMSHGVSFPDNLRRAAAYVDKILKGATPASIPVEDPRTYELVVNLRTARAIGITLPRSVLLRATQVVE